MSIAVNAWINQKNTITKRQVTLKALHNAVGWNNDLSLAQSTHWFSLALEFEPDLILEFGRGQGNSTAIFTEAANNLPGCTVKSFCLTPGWTRKEAVAKIVKPEWFSPLQIYSGDITEIDFAQHTKGAKRILILWDAHGFQVAEALLVRLLPLISDRQHLVVCHDISDNRVINGAGMEYESKSFWRGMDDYYAHLNTTSERTRLNLFWLNTIVDQAIPIVDFCTRNSIELHSPDFEMKQFKQQRPDEVQSLHETLGNDLFAETTHWMYFSLNEAGSSHTFPAQPNTITPSTGTHQSSPQTSSTIISSAQINSPDRERLFRFFWKSLLVDLPGKLPKVAIFGAGQHTRQLLRIIKDQSGPEIKWILDDHSSDGQIEGIPIIKPPELSCLDVNGIVISSDAHESRLYERAIAIYENRLPVFKIYGETRP